MAVEIETEKTVTYTYICDVCHTSKENDERFTQRVTVPTMFTTNQTDGAPTEPYLHRAILDLCDTCLDKVTVLKGKGAQGNNKYIFR